MNMKTTNCDEWEIHQRVPRLKIMAGIQFAGAVIHQGVLRVLINRKTKVVTVLYCGRMAWRAKPNPDKTYTVVSDPDNNPMDMEGEQ